MHESVPVSIAFLSLFVNGAVFTKRKSIIRIQKTTKSMLSVAMAMVSVMMSLFLELCVVQAQNHTSDLPIYFRLISEIDSLYLARNRTISNALYDLQRCIPQMSPVVRSSSRFHRSIEEEASLRAHKLTMYYVTYPKHFGTRSPETIVAELKKNPIVDEAYIESPHFLAELSSHVQMRIPDYTNCFSRSDCQMYMDSSDPQPGFMLRGVNGFIAHREAKNKGENQRILLIESQSWFADHIDLKTPGITFALEYNITVGENDQTDVEKKKFMKAKEHCTMTAGVIFGQDNGFGITGFVPNAQVGFAKYSSNLLVELSNHLVAGDVVQIGIEYGSTGDWCPIEKKCYFPVEFKDLPKRAIGHLVDRGVHVILAAGNGNVDLDHPNLNGKFADNDTGAIYVGAANPESGDRAFFSNYGSRVNLHSWGFNVTTTKWKNTVTDHNDLFTTSYSGTSATTAIIAGCAAFLQSVAKQRGYGNIPPKCLRQILFDSGTPVLGTGQKNIGVQPDLIRALQLLNEYHKNKTITINSTDAPLAPIANTPTVTTISPQTFALDKDSAEHALFKFVTAKQ